jgi:hypothetical protein
MEDKKDYDLLLEKWTNNELIRKYVDIHIVYKNENYKYPINYLKWISKKYSTTKYSLIMDIDYYIPNQFKMYLNKVELKKDEIIFISVYKIVNNVKLLPNNFDELNDLLNKKGK